MEEGVGLPERLTQLYKVVSLGITVPEEDTNYISTITKWAEKLANNHSTLTDLTKPRDTYTLEAKEAQKI